MKYRLINKVHLYTVFEETFGLRNVYLHVVMLKAITLRTSDKINKKINSLY